MKIFCFVFTVLLLSARVHEGLAARAHVEEFARLRDNSEAFRTGDAVFKSGAKFPAGSYVLAIGALLASISSGLTPEGKAELSRFKESDTVKLTVNGDDASVIFPDETVGWFSISDVINGGNCPPTSSSKLSYFCQFWNSIGQVYQAIFQSQHLEDSITQVDVFNDDFRPDPEGSTYPTIFPTASVTGVSTSQPSAGSTAITTTGSTAITTAGSTAATTAGSTSKSSEESGQKKKGGSGFTDLEIAGITIGSIFAALLAGYGAKKAYDSRNSHQRLGTEDDGATGVQIGSQSNTIDDTVPGSNPLTGGSNDV